ncbi:MAG: aminoacyl-histidine dipeptidase [Porphyromonadaceae bacterium]|nr:aminoacyl-histidine dipeptidase [Porphyromonadaceae bacterium]
MKFEGLEPQVVWHYFEEITQVPRPSKKEGKIRAYLLDFAQKQGLTARTDATGNVLIVKPATPGCEGKPGVVLQAHMDMVCEKNSGVTHDFERDPIDAYVDGEWVKARGTTLGADNGIGMATALAVLASDNLVHPALEALFTVDEETGLTGAFGLEEGFLSGEYLLNLDSENEAELFIGCAGGCDTVATFTYTPQPLPAGSMALRVGVSKLLGGHSGSDIHEGRGNANKILARFLCQCMEKYPVSLCAMDGGNLRNAIPREACAVIAVPTGCQEGVRVDLNLYQSVVEQELAATDGAVELSLSSCDMPAQCIDSTTAAALLRALYACPHGVIGMSRDIPGLVETSTNLASVKMGEGNTIVVATSQRSSVESLKNDTAAQVKALFTLAGAQVDRSDGYPGWKPNLKSHLLDVAVKAYEELYGVTPAVKAIHAGLECGLFLEKNPNLCMISFGPTLLGVHSPDERMHIPAVEKFWNHLTLILRKLGEC